MIVSITSIVTTTAIAAGNVINESITSKQIGNDLCANDPIRLTEKDWQNAAEALGVKNTASLKAIYWQESRGKSFLKDGRVKILFERHYMYRILKQKGFTQKTLSELEENCPDIVCRKSQPKGTYGSESHQYEKLAIAKTIDEGAAIESTSWGGFQVMRQNYKELFDTPQEMEAAMQASEVNQLKFSFSK